MAKAKQGGRDNTKRIVSFALLTFILFFAAVARAFEYQIVDSEKYISAAHRSSYTTVKVTAARGEIVDRNGVPFTKNIAAFNVEFDYAFLKPRTENKVIYNLIKTFEARNEEWIDNLPITMTKPYQFTEGKESDIAKLKKRVGVNEYATAQNCMDAIYEYYDSRYAKNSEFKDVVGIEYLDYTEEYKRKIAGVRYSMILNDFSSYNPRYTFAKDVATYTVALLRELSDDFVGVSITEKSERTYVGGEVASHIIGRLGRMNEQQLDYYTSIEGNDYAMDDMVGQGGIEEAFEGILRGQNGEMRIYKDTKGNITEVVESLTPKAGKTIALTIDYNFNKEVNSILADFITNFNETNKDDKHIDAAAVVVLDVKTGGVLSTTSYPYYDQSEYYNNYSLVAQAEGNPLFNRALQGLYRPGSTFKPVVAAGGFMENTITAGTKIFCDGYYHYWPSWNPLPSCLSDGHRNIALDVVDALKWSCNVFFYETGRVIGIDNVVKYANMFGLGTETGLEIPNRTGVISNPEHSESLGMKWEQGNVIQTAIGQMDTQVTPLQMAIEAMTLANNGTRYSAHLLKSIYSNDLSELLQQEKVEIKSQLNMETEAGEAIKQGMIDVGERISSIAALEYDVAVKTGTPQVSAEKTNNAFIAYAPADNPEIAIACMLEDGLRANTIIADILEAYQKSK